MVLSIDIKFTPQGEIAINVECQGREENTYQLLFSVSDTGIGISKQGTFFDLGFDGYLSKPLQIQTLQETLMTIKSRAGTPPLVVDV